MSLRKRLQAIMAAVMIVVMTMFIMAACDGEEKRDFGPMITAESESDKLIYPFWRLNTMYNESTSMIVREDGSITAKLLFKPTRIISVMDNSLKNTYEEGVDYTWDGKSSTLVWKEGSSITYFTQNDIEGKLEDGTQLPLFSGTMDDLGRSRFGNALYCVSAFLYEKQIAVTYEYEYGSWYGDITEYQGDVIPKTMAKLNNKEAITLVYYGDSIFTGCDSSEMHVREPRQTSFPQFTKQILEERYGADIKLINTSVGGMDSLWGSTNAVDLVAKHNPDLVIIGFGMNDGGREGTQTASNVEYIMRKALEANPDCEFVVVAPMVPNAEAGFLTTHTQLSAAFKDICGDGIAFVDMFNFHSKLLERKDFISMSGNNINHPNDWLIRVYAMNILSVFIEW